jgi:hypothetical protein
MRQCRQGDRHRGRFRQALLKLNLGRLYDSIVKEHAICL